MEGSSAARRLLAASRGICEARVALLSPPACCCQCALPLLQHVDQRSPSCAPSVAPESQLLKQRFACSESFWAGIYVCGGSNGSASMSRAEYLDLQVGEWQALPPLSAGRSGAVAGVLFGRLYVAGGQDGSSNCPRHRSVAKAPKFLRRWSVSTPGRRPKEFGRVVRLEVQHLGRAATPAGA